MPVEFAAPTLTRKDEEQLDLLGVFFYVYAIFVAFVALVLGAVALGSGLFLTQLPQQHDGPPPALLGGFMAAMFGLAMVLMGVKAVLMVLTGQALRSRTRHTLAVVGSCLAMINIPLGLVLGIFSLVHLQKPQVKARFA
jgi:hypothetical protein